MYESVYNSHREQSSHRTEAKSGSQGYVVGLYLKQMACGLKQTGADATGNSTYETSAFADVSFLRLNGKEMLIMITISLQP